MTIEHAYAEAEAESLLADLVDEITQRLNAGESVSLDEYATRYPQFSESLASLLEALTLVRQAGVADDDFQIDENSEPRGQLGDFYIEREIGRGGMGIVYEAEQISLGRRVALKVLPFVATLSPAQLQRFKNEARSAAALKHPNIVGVYSIGCERGVHYYAMEYVEGPSLAEVVEIRARSREQGAESSGVEQQNGRAVEQQRSSGAEEKGSIAVVQQNSSNSTTPLPHSSSSDNRYSTTPLLHYRSSADTAPVAALSTLKTTQPAEFFRSIARLGIQAAEALDYAHQMDVVHRDIKPSNLLLDVAGKLWITDFGLAMTQSDAGLTMTGDLLGTLRYMSPEQAAGKRLPLDHRTDIYSLGITLYELLAGRPAFDSSERAELLRAIAETEPAALRKLVPPMPADLETIVHKAIEKDAADRYNSAGELAADLRRFLDDRPIVARPPAIAARARKWMRRHSTAVAAAVGVLVVAVVGLSIGAAMLNSAYRHSAERERQAEKNLQIAVDTIDRLLARVADDADIHGQLHHAEQLYVDAANAYDRVLENTNNAAFVLRAANSRAELAVVLAESGRHDRALEEAERGLRLLQTLSSIDNLGVREMEVRAHLLDLQGWAQLHRHQYAAAEWSLSEALHLREQLLDTGTDRLKHLKKMSEALNSMAVLRSETGQLDEGERLLRRALSIRASLPEKERGDGVWLSDAAGLMGNLGGIDRDRGNYAAAEELFREAAELMRQAIERRPNYQAYRQDLYNCRWNLADTLVRAGRHDDAASEVASITSEFPERLQAHVEGVWLLMQCIEGVTAADSPASSSPSQAANSSRSNAERYRAQAREIVLKTSTATFAPPAMQLELAWLLATCPDRTLRDGQRAIEIVEQLSASGFQSSRLQHTLCAAHLQIQAFDEAYDVVKSSLRMNSSASAHDWLLLALAQAGRGELDDARRWYANALAGSRNDYCYQGLLSDAKKIFDPQSSP
jgi:serine/threonine protein kinase